ncbi:hypothetical protein KAT24_00820 [Candidatus Pacearchaeota archaeon]|nr:hypothetical protein [Candidatus Pacearchaeota archaeon]
MVNEVILGALRSALTRGESLKRAMMTLYNAGYKKEEISEAARLINENGLASSEQPTSQVDTKKLQQPVTAQMLAPSTQLSSKSSQPKQLAKQIQQPQTLQQLQVPQQQVQQPMQQQPPAQNMLQKVSGYGQPPKPGSKTMIIILGFLLLLLMGILVTIFLFKDELLGFFNNLFG